MKRQALSFCPSAMNIASTTNPPGLERRMAAYLQLNLFIHACIGQVLHSGPPGVGVGFIQFYCARMALTDTEKCNYIQYPRFQGTSLGTNLAITASARPNQPLTGGAGVARRRGLGGKLATARVGRPGVENMGKHDPQVQCRMRAVAGGRSGTAG